MAQNSRQEQNNQSALAEPFSKIFADRAEAEWAFDLLREASRRLRISGPYDPRMAVTVSTRAGRPFLHLNFGNWLVLGFNGPGHTLTRVEIALLAHLVSWDERFVSFASDRKEGEPEVRSYQLPLEATRPLTSHLRQAFETTLDFIADKFAAWKRSPHWKQHNPELVEAFFDPHRRALLFAGGLDEPELRYERHYTAFDYELAEDGVEYGVGESGAIDMKQSTTQPELAAPYPLSQLAADTGLDEETVARWVRAIGRKGQAILYGPPGTGKTFVAEKLAAHLVGGGDGFTELVQFHPAYAYEDFIQGIRPQSEGDRLSYPVVPGRFLEFCRQAQHRRDTCVLIIDEINRANLSRVFGELMYLLEYRDRAIPLAGAGQLKIPANVRLIGTMNTADRSIALVDHALRRRFAFIALRPNFDALRRYHQKTGFPVEGLVNVLERLNQRIEDDYRLGITFFMDEHLADHVEDIWRLEIEPYLEEYFFDRREEVNDFRWERVKAEILPA